MERINYSELVQNILKQHIQNDLENNTEIQLIFDKEGNHYQLLNLGWQGYKRIYGCIIHVDIKDDKIWIQQDNTEVGIANELVLVGVPKKDIVLAFQAPYKRKFTDYAPS